MSARAPKIPPPAASEWINVDRPGYFGKRRDGIHAGFNDRYGKDNWRLVWIVRDEVHTFVEACKAFYEEAYFEFLCHRPQAIMYITSFCEVIDNAPTNVQSGCDYAFQESASNHIQDIAVRNVLRRLDIQFTSERQEHLVIRGEDSNGFNFNPGNVPFHAPKLITQPSLRPKWARENSVEDFWQSCKFLQVKN